MTFLTDMENRKIESILIDGGDCHYSKDGEIVKFTKKGEMARVDWYSQTLVGGETVEFNGKYVIKIVFAKKEVGKKYPHDDFDVPF